MDSLSAQPAYNRLAGRHKILGANAGASQAAVLGSGLAYPIDAPLADARPARPDPQVLSATLAPCAAAKIRCASTGASQAAVLIKRYAVRVCLAGGRSDLHLFAVSDLSELGGR